MTETTLENSLLPERLGDRAVHLCVDMQNLFAGGTAWSFEWMPRVLPAVQAIAERHAVSTIFTRFIPAMRPGEGSGMWRRYYLRWAEMTLEAVGPDAVELVDPLRQFAPPAEVLDKPVYSPWIATPLQARLRDRCCDTLVISGGETDMCVLATVMGAVDFGYRTILVKDALCSSSDETHDAMLELYSKRFSAQIEVWTVEELLERWPAR